MACSAKKPKQMDPKWATICLNVLGAWIFMTVYTHVLYLIFHAHLPDKIDDFDATIAGFMATNV